MNELLERFSGQLMILVIIAVISAGLALRVRRVRSRPFGLRPAPSCLAIGSALAIAATTLTRQTGAREPGRVQLELFHTISSDLGDASDVAVYVVGNVALFVPLGFFLYLALRRGLALPAGMTVLSSVCVEILQLPIWSRSSDVDDVLLNSVGGLLGVLAAAGVILISARAGTRLRLDDEQPEPPSATLAPAASSQLTLTAGSRCPPARIAGRATAPGCGRRSERSPAE